MKTWLLSLPLLIAATAASAEQVLVRSPNGRIVAQISDQGGLSYTVEKDGQQLIEPSGLGLTLDRGGPLGSGSRIVGTERTQRRAAVQLGIGKASEAMDRHEEVRIQLEEASGSRRRLQLVVRAYDDGVALRYILPQQQQLDGVFILSEETQFNFPADYRCWGTNLGRFRTSHEGEYDPVPASKIRYIHQYELPLTCETGALGALAVAEADVRSYPASYLRGRGDGKIGVQTLLSPSLDDERIAARTRIGSDVVAPWRVIFIGDRAGDLIPSNLIKLLSSPPAERDWSWVRPGKTAWDWWSGPWLASGTKPVMDTETLRRFIDFAADSGLEYMMIDEGWYAGAGGAEVVRPGVDITRPSRDVDLPDLIRHARSRGVGLWLWLNWKALDAQMDEALPLYQKWGIKGIKVDFMDRDDQAMVQWYERVLKKAADHRLMVNFHGAYHPTGLSRTYPNLLTQEGVLAAEYNKWSGRITATHNVTIPYTRMLLGPLDYTPGSFNNATPADWRPRMINPVVQTTRGQALAMYVVYESGFQAVADSPDVYAASPAGFDFIKIVPPSWDETRFISGSIGEDVVLARRNGRQWFLGAMTNEQGKSLQVPLTFLPAGRHQATIYQDGDRATELRIQKRVVTSGDQLDLRVAGSGGAAVHFTPILGGKR